MDHYTENNAKACGGIIYTYASTERVEFILEKRFCVGPIERVKFFDVGSLSECWKVWDEK